MYILHIASELAPVAKAGGLADVVYGLSKELVRQGHKVKIVLPKYDCLDYNILKNLKVHYRELWSYEGAYKYNNTIWSAEMDGLELYLLEPHHPRYFFHRGHIYGSEDDMERFLYFSRAVMEFLFKTNEHPDVLHIHDWPTAIIPILLKDMYLSLGFPSIKTVCTIHNFEHQGRCTTHKFSETGLRGETYLTPEKLQDTQYPHLLNLLQGAVIYSSHITTVSPSYKQEILLGSADHHPPLFLRKYAEKFHGILNGIDIDFWNPDIDPYLHAHFTKDDLPRVFEKKKENKTHLQKKLGLQVRDTLLVACVARLVPQKGPFLIAEAFKHVLTTGGQCVILGTCYSQEMHDFFSLLAREYQELFPSQGAIILAYDEALSHLIYAGSDLFLVPSLFEPCGLTQMIAMRYGSIPLVRQTGGLADTVLDNRNGFTFIRADREPLITTLDRAIKTYHAPKKWQKLVKQALSEDNSWQSAAKKYLELYEH